MNTKIALIALMTTVGAAGAASAGESYFTFGNVVPAASQVDFDLIRSEGNGIVALYDYTGGVKGALVGETALRAGANSDVSVDVMPSGAQSYLAEIIVDGQIVASKTYMIRG